MGEVSAQHSPYLVGEQPTPPVSGSSTSLSHKCLNESMDISCPLKPCIDMHLAVSSRIFSG